MADSTARNEQESPDSAQARLDSFTTPPDGRSMGQLKVDRATIRPPKPAFWQCGQPPAQLK
jgi:hypothetical protein